MIDRPHGLTLLESLEHDLGVNGPAFRSWSRHRCRRWVEILVASCYRGDRAIPSFVEKEA